jgi:methylenetetrahydrofolate dehydrogenase (NADP+) / methenyltetrahydrofolate cyclohydrolase
VSVNERVSLGLSRPKLCVVLVGDNSASLTYITGKRKACEEIGFDFELKQYAPSITEDELVSAIESINADATIHGCIVQLPLPPQISAIRIIDTIDPLKDVDGFTRANIGNLFLGKSGLESCTPQGIMRLLSYYGIDPSGKHAVVIGRSAIVGRPLSLMLMHAGATVTLCHSQTVDLSSHTLRADIIVVAIGKSRFLTADMV